LRLEDVRAPFYPAAILHQVLNSENIFLASTTLQDSGATAKGTTTASNDPVHKPVTNIPSPDQCKASDDTDTDFNMDSGKWSLVIDVLQFNECHILTADPTCPCKDGWLSPRMKFILSSTCYYFLKVLPIY
jgi:hypothetical protein